MKFLIGALVIICTVVVWALYHKIFDVYYFGSGGCLREIIACFFGGVILAGLIIKFWYIGLIIGIITVGIYMYKANS